MKNKNFNLVSAEEIDSLEDYVSALISSTASLKTLEAFNLIAFKKGLLDQDESEVATTICWEIQKLIQLHNKQVENVLERTSISESEIINKLNDQIKGLVRMKKPNDKKH